MLFGLLFKAKYVSLGLKSIIFTHSFDCFPFLAFVCLHVSISDMILFLFDFSNWVFFSSPKQKVASVLDLIGGGSRSTTPVSLNSRKSPTADMAVQVNKSGANNINNSKDGNGGQKRNNQNRGQRERRDSSKNDGGQSGGNNSMENKVKTKNLKFLLKIIFMHLKKQKIKKIKIESTTQSIQQ